jgi:tetratricopeptide (TPR) repeat protein
MMAAMSDRPMHTVPGAMERLTALYADGERALDEGRFADAIAKFSEGLAIDDHFRQRYVTMYAQRAFAKQRAGDAMGAIPDYTRALELEPPINQAQYYFHRGMCFVEIGGHEEHALQDYARSSSIYPDHPGPYHLRGKLLITLERWEEAIAEFDRLLERTPNPEGYQLRGYARLNLDEGVAAIPDLMESARRAPAVYTDYLLAWAGAIAPDDDLFYRSMAAVLEADPSYRPYFLDNPDYARFLNEPRFQSIVGPG